MSNWEKERENAMATDVCMWYINRIISRELDRVQMRNFCPLFIDLMVEVLVHLLYYLSPSLSLIHNQMSLFSTHWFHIFIWRWMLISTHFIAFLHRFDLRRVFINFKNEKCAYKWKRIEYTHRRLAQPPNEEERTNQRKKYYYGNAFVLQFIKCTNVGLSFTYPHSQHTLTYIIIVDSQQSFLSFCVSFDNKMKRINLNLCKM